MSALGAVVRGGLVRRRVQTAVMFLAVAMAVTATVLGGSLLVASNAPFDHAFAAQRGAHLTAQFDAQTTTIDQLVATAHLDGVADTAGPFPTATVNATAADPDQPPGTSGGFELPPMTLVGRSSASGSIDRVELLSGNWPTAAGEVVVSEDLPVAVLGETLTVADLPNSPTLTIVGIARSVSATADGWVTPSEIADLQGRGTATGYEMLYRFDHAGTTSQMAANQASIVASVPAGGMVGSRSWLDVKQGSDRNTAVFIPFLVTFGLLGIVMSVLIVGSIVAGATASGRRRIGILKAVGSTPGQIVRAHALTALVPAVIATIVGLAVGNALTVPILATTEQVYGTSASGISPWVDAVVALGMIGLVAIVAFAASARAGRLRTVDALAVRDLAGHRRGRRAAHLANRLPWPSPIAAGFVRPFARPGRAISMVLAVAFGAAAVTFAFGLSSSLTRVEAARNHDSGDVQAVAPDGVPNGVPGPIVRGQSPAPSAVVADPAAVAAAIASQPGTASFYGVARSDVTVAGVTGSTAVYAFSGDASADYELVTGRWFRGSGEIVVPKTFLTTTGLRVGDTVTLVDHGASIRPRIVGEVFDPHEQTMEVFTDISTMSAARPDLQPRTFSITVQPDTDATAYATALDAVLQPMGAFTFPPGRGGSSDVILALDTLTAALTLMLAAVAALGVLNTLVLDTRERAHEIGIHRAIGMTPAQTITMVLTSVLVVGLAGGAIGVALGTLLHAAVLPAMGRSAGLSLPRSVLDVYQPAELVALGLGGLVIALAGALLPSTWAARTPVVATLRTE